jgi:drug/metabolite transporter (DMT)-like permease
MHEERMNADTARATPERSRTTAFAALVAGACAMGASPLFVRFADVGPQASAFWRTALAIPALWLWMRIEERHAHAMPFRPDRAIVLAGVCFAGDLFFWHLAILNTSVANATFFAVSAPVFVVAGAFLFLGERSGPRVFLGLAACVAGGAALIGQSYQVDPARLSGDFYGVVTALFFGAYVVAVRNARMQGGAARLMFLSTAVSAALLLLAALIIEQPLVPRSLDGLVSLLALALVSQVGGQGLLAFALGALPATFSSLVIFLEAVAAAALGWIFLGEPLTPIQTLGGLLIFLGIYIARPRAAAPAGAAL